MSPEDPLAKHSKTWKSALIMFGALFVLLFVFEGAFAIQNIQAFLARRTYTVSFASLPAEKGVPDTLSIPSLGIHAPVIYISEKNESAYQRALADGVVHYPGTALPGAFGNVYIFGHSSDVPWSGGHYKTIFAPLTQIENGDAIFLTDHDGKVFTYDVFETKVVTPNDLSVLSQYENQEQLLSLQTSYPLGTALRRFIVLARLRETN